MILTNIYCKYWQDKNINILSKSKDKINKYFWKQTDKSGQMKLSSWQMCAHIIKHSACHWTRRALWEITSVCMYLCEYVRLQFYTLRAKALRWTICTRHHHHLDRTFSDFFLFVILNELKFFSFCFLCQLQVGFFFEIVYQYIRKYF